MKNRRQPGPSATLGGVQIATFDFSDAPRETFTCSKCGDGHNRAGQAYCCKCHAAYMRTWRKTHPLTPIQRLKDTARSYANAYKHRGYLVPKSCENCGSPDSEMHHEDYTKPLVVTWLCRPCHLALHHNPAAVERAA